MQRWALMTKRTALIRREEWIRRITIPMKPRRKYGRETTPIRRICWSQVSAKTESGVKCQAMASSKFARCLRRSLALAKSSAK